MAQHLRSFSQRRAFIGGSDARIIMGSDEAALSASGAKNAARPTRKTCLAISSCSSGLRPKNSTDLVRAKYGPACHGCAAPRQAFGHPLDGRDPGRHCGGN